MTATIGRVARRHVIFLCGFDPRGASFYHALYRTEALKQSAVTGMSIQVVSRQSAGDGNSTWRINSELPDGRRCETTFEFLRWDDIVRRHWPRNVWRLLMDVPVACTVVLRSHFIVPVWRVSRRFLVTVAFPALLLGGGLALCVGMGALLAGLLYMGTLTGGNGVGSVWAAVGGLLALGFGLGSVRLLEARLHPTWLVNIFSFTGKQIRGDVPELDGRLNAAAQKLAGRIRANAVDEILVVGFSVGSFLAVSVVARALTALDTLKASIGQADGRQVGTSAESPTELAAHGQPVLSLLTLGHCIPMMGLHPKAITFRQELKKLALAKTLRWIDFSSVTDWGSFAMVDPVKLCNVLPQAASAQGVAVNPTMRSPRFHALFAPSSYLVLRRNKRRLHMQYLMASELGGDYDYFAITAGPVTLGSRYADGQSALV